MHRLGEIVKKESFNKYVTTEVVAIVQDLANKFIEDPIYGIEATATWCEMTAFKYRMRVGTKPDNPVEQDLDKERWYLNKAKELRSKLE